MTPDDIFVSSLTMSEGTNSWATLLEKSLARRTKKAYKPAAVLAVLDNFALVQSANIPLEQVVQRCTDLISHAIGEPTTSAYFPLFRLSSQNERSEAALWTLYQGGSRADFADLADRHPASNESLLQHADSLHIEKELSDVLADERGRQAVADVIQQVLLGDDDEASSRLIQAYRTNLDPFEVGRAYTRAEVQDALGVPEDERGGNWDTGLHPYRGDHFIFANVDTASRTGHDYANRWKGDLLEWTGRTGSKYGHESIKRLLSKQGRIFLFWRDQDRAPFIYAGQARPVDVDEAAVPVRVIWATGPSPKEPGIRLPEEVDAPDVETRLYREGAVRTVTVNAYERDPQARRDCIDYYGYTCWVCGFDFGDTYPSWGEGFIHVHHLNPIAGMGGDYEVDPVKDLRPVCPNCHGILHRGSQPPTLDQLCDLFPTVSRRQPPTE